MEQNKQLVCGNNDVLILQKNSIDESLKNCSAITGRNILQADQRDFLELIRQPSGPKYCWLPLRDRAAEEHFINKYSNSSFNVSLLAAGRRNVGDKLNLLFWRYFPNGTFDANEMYKYYSLCEHDTQPRSLKPRGLCSSYPFEKEYYPTMQVYSLKLSYASLRTLVWRGNGGHEAWMVCPSDPSDGRSPNYFCYFRCLEQSRYSSRATIMGLVNIAEPFGTHHWLIDNNDNDTCSKNRSYDRTVSFR